MATEATVVAEGTASIAEEKQIGLIGAVVIFATLATISSKIESNMVLTTAT